MKIGLSTGGGDCPGLNAVIRAATKHAIGTYKMEVIGIRDSFNGLIKRPYETMPLSIEKVAEILTRGGTILGTTSSGNPFKFKDNTAKVEEDKSQLVLDAYRDLDLDGLIVVGGDGTQGICQKLSQLGLNIIGIPKTIDNDLIPTDLTVGFDTAVAVAAEATERLQSTAESHERVMILEVMGRDAGHIALHAGIAGGANIILLPEIPFAYEPIIDKLTSRKKLGRHFSVIVVAEGAYQQSQNKTYTTNSSGSQNLGGVGQNVAQEIYNRTGIETRVTVLGHIQRGGIPTPDDRVLASAFGAHAIDMAHGKRFGRIIGMKGGELIETRYEDIQGKYRPISLDHHLIKTAESIGICLGRPSRFQLA